jgi:catechol 2,3-dioxygenase-like lactoylglutathione lyase family enzyme
VTGALVPELSVRDCAASLRFYRDVLGFALRYQRPEEGFAYLALGEAELMLDQIGLGRDFDPGLAAEGPPFGRGLNLQIRVASLAPLLAGLRRHGVTLLLGPEERWYRRDDVEAGQRQLVVADPDGYLLRFCEDIGTRAR